MAFRLSYPSDEDIRYARWLKHFATQLPAYASRYDLPILRVLEMQCIAGEFIDLLIHRMHCTTASIVMSWQPRLVSTDYQNLLNEVTGHAENERVLRRLVAAVVAYVQLHPAYTVHDGQALDIAHQVASSRLARANEAASFTKGIK